MEKRINKKIESYVTEFKDSMRNKISSFNFEDKNTLNELLEYIYDYQRLVIVKDDMVKRKRIKNSIPALNRCCAKRANGEQCTRRRKENCDFCGTHSKGTPHGLIQLDGNTGNDSHKLEVFAEEISGIVYYLDKYNNVYKTEDILDGKQNPVIIAKYKITNGLYSIPDFGL